MGLKDCGQCFNIEILGQYFLSEFVMLPELEEDLNVLWAFVNEMSTLEDFDHCIKEFKDWKTQK